MKKTQGIWRGGGLNCPVALAEKLPARKEGWPLQKANGKLWRRHLASGVSFSRYGQEKPQAGRRRHKLTFYGSILFTGTAAAAVFSFVGCGTAISKAAIIAVIKASVELP